MSTSPRRKLMRAAISAAALSALALSGCAAGGGESAGGTIRLVWNDGFTKQMNEVIAAFEKSHHDIKVEATYLRSADISALLSTQLPAGTAPDIIGVLPGFGTMSTVGLADSGYLLDLSKESWAADNLKIALPYVSRGSKVYGYDPAIAFQNFIYNTDLFSRLGVKPPSTFDDLISMCTKVSSNGITPIAIPFADSFLGATAVVSVANSFVDPTEPKWEEDRLKNTVTFAQSAGWKTTLERVQEMNKANCFGKDPQAVRNDDQVKDLATGKAASAFLSSDAVAGVIRPLNADFKWGMFAAPADKASETRATWYGGPAMSIYAKSKHAAAAREFVSFFASQQQSQTYAEAIGATSARDANKGDWKTTPELADLGDLVLAGRASFISNYNWPGAASEAMGVGVQSLLQGKSDAQSVLSSVDAAWKG